MRRSFLIIVVAALIGCGGGGGGTAGGDATSGSSNGGDGGGTTSGGGDGGSGTGGSTGGVSSQASYPASITSASPTLDDGGHYGTVGFVALSSGTATVTATASAFDPIVVVERVADDGTREVVAEDDDADGSTGAKASVPVVAGVHYAVMAISVSGDPSGDVALGYSSDLLAPDGRGKARSAVRLIPLPKGPTGSKGGRR